MNRNRRCALLAPLLASAVALPPTAVAQAAAPDRAPAAPRCELKEIRLGEDPAEFDPEQIEYDLHLNGFPAKQSVRIDGPRTKLNAKVNGRGSLTREDVAYGVYRVTYDSRRAGDKVRVNCLAPPREVPGGVTGGDAKVTKVEITKVFTPQPTKVDCDVPNKVQLDGQITATGRGKVTFTWQGKNIVAQQGSVEFTGKEKIHSVLGSLTVPKRETPNAMAIEVVVNLVAVNPGPEPVGASKTLTLDCN
ncbi:hypothetical protein DEJ50_20445 [Streptomyces venezuelae]|uniref:Secreted protein n=1 Tax=Streptomyces venezuelae TaxID=54571 RepID=A0A5P2D6Y0_STRVZ|nr:hypothetical protein [Streptomyces venezuelae]QES49838.1 hypothetical protein DEJ50_20445 [Streptomyces venezuelae]